MSAAAVPRFTPEELDRFLIAPDAGERLSPLGGAGALVLDLLGEGAGNADGGLERVATSLPWLPCVTIAVGGGAAATEGRRLADACDVALADDRGLDALVAGFADTPRAALAFVQLLRGSETAPIPAALVAESFVYSTLQSGSEFGHWLAGWKRRRRRVRPDDAPACRLERDRGRLEIWLSRPARRNAFSRAMRDALVEACQLAIADPGIEEIVVRGDGEAFCSGGDLDEFGSFPDAAEAHVIRTTRSPALLLSRLAARVRAEVHGACIGAGVELPAFVGRVVADEDAFFQLPEVGMGLVPGAGGTVSLPRRIGRQRTAWLGLSGQRIDARVALDWGLVDEVRLGQDL